MTSYLWMCLQRDTWWVRTKLKFSLMAKIYSEWASTTLNIKHTNLVKSSFCRQWGSRKGLHFLYILCLTAILWLCTDIFGMTPCCGLIRWDQVWSIGGGPGDIVSSVWESIIVTRAVAREQWSITNAKNNPSWPASLHWSLAKSSSHDCI